MQHHIALQVKQQVKIKILGRIAFAVLPSLLENPRTGRFPQQKPRKVCCLVLIAPGYKALGGPVGVQYYFTSMRNSILLLKILLGIMFQSPAQNRQNDFHSHLPLHEHTCSSAQGSATPTICEVSPPLTHTEFQIFAVKS